MAKSNDPKSNDPKSNEQGAAPYLPPRRTLKTLREAVQQCRGCDLYLHATQAVFGEGPKTARIVLVGEQPGNDEDLQGHPFVGPAGKLLDRALADAGLDRAEIYLTNAVKHFSFEERGKRRIHKKPKASEVNACKPWLEAEIEAIKPAIIVCLGATAAQAILGSDFRVSQDRGRPFEHPWVEHPWPRYVVATVHPSAILRTIDSEQRHEEYSKFVADLKKIRELM